jgi:competence protein ComFC
LSLPLICKDCQSIYLTPNLQKKEIITGFFVYSFYDYEDIKEFIYSKYDVIGSQIFEILAKNSFELFANSFNFDERVYSISIDDNVNKGYSHSAILNNALKSRNIKPLYNKLQAQNNVIFANKSYGYRLSNPRDFIYKKPLFKKVKNVILVDDIITSGLTLLEAKDTLTREGINTLFAITLCNLQEG